MKRDWTVSKRTAKEVTLRFPCWACDGSGDSGDWQNLNCRSCKGGGKMERKEGLYPALGGALDKQMTFRSEAKAFGYVPFNCGTNYGRRWVRGPKGGLKRAQTVPKMIFVHQSLLGVEL